MIIKPLEIRGAYLLVQEPNKDERGDFSRIFCINELNKAGIEFKVCQANLCNNLYKNTLRGMHMQIGESAEDKIVMCNRGKIFDVFIDMREESDTYLKYYGEELSENNRKMFLIPKGCAHGYITLENNSQLVYLMSQFYQSGKSTGYRFDDPAFCIQWPQINDIIISDKDKSWEYIEVKK